MDISVVIPVYGCKAALPELHKRLTESLSQITDAYEIILVDDHCPQNSWEEIVKLCQKDKRVKGFHLSRNFGQFVQLQQDSINQREIGLLLWIVICRIVLKQL